MALSQYIEMQHFVDNQYQVVFGDINEFLGTAFAEELNSGRDAVVAVFHLGDVTQPDAFSELFSTAEKHFGTVHVLVNNAGIAQSNIFWASDAWRKTVKLNLEATIAGTAAALGYFMSKKLPGAVINISSFLALVPFEGEPVYAATKAAVLSFTRSLKVYAPLTGVQVNAICPVYVDTPLLTGMRKLSDHHESRLSSVPKLEPLEVAQAVLRTVEDTTMAGDAMLLAVNREPTLMDDKTDIWELLADSLPSTDV
ncbi:hypothetical protein IWQ61_006451 [Dispira simplex]|nr:hypothetical protein IWQ61_006451 [Dispira simplex]